jgi:DNA-binding protein H-NS
MIDLDTRSPEELTAIIVQAQAELAAKQHSKRKDTIAKIKELAVSIGVTVEIHDLDKKVAKRSASSVSAKYRNPNGPETWTGRGLAPKWMKALLEAGRNKAEFLIQS